MVDHATHDRVEEHFEDFEDGGTRVHRLPQREDYFVVSAPEGAHASFTVTITPTQHLEQVALSERTVISRRVVPLERVQDDPQSLLILLAQIFLAADFLELANETIDDVKEVFACQRLKVQALALRVVHEV